MSTDDQSKTKNTWRFVQLNEFSAPSEPTPEAVRTGLRALWARLRQQPSEPELESHVEPSELRSAPTQLLERLVPSPDWTSVVAEALDDALARWLQIDCSVAGVQTIVVGPASGVADGAEYWARQYDFPVIEAPTTGEILTGGDEWFERWPDLSQTRYLIPHVDRMFLRHHHGLNLVRRLFDRLGRQREATLLVCDSWAWSYLAQTCRTNLLLSTPLTLAPFTPARLQNWLEEDIASRNRNFRFRRTDNGRLVLRPAHMAESDDPEEKVSSDFLNQVAVNSRGNPGVAWAMWRKSLHIAVDDEDEKEIEEEAQAEAAQDQGRTIWVRPWDKIERPTLPSDTSSATAFVLLYLLQHNGLSYERLAGLLPLHPDDTANSVHHLQRAQLIGFEHGQYRVTPLGYPTVRSFLRQEGYQVDQL